MNILLINPKIEGVDAWQPIGLAYLAAVLERAGHTVEIWDCNIDADKSFKKYEIIGISIPFSFAATEALKLVRGLKIIFPLSRIIAGGPHATTRWLEIIKLPFIDAVIVGEGEEAILEAVEGKDYYYNKEFINDLDSLPFPARHLLPLDKYFESKGRSRNAYVYSDRWTSIITSRGCPFRCSFCSVHPLVGSNFRFRSARNVVAEIKECYEKYGITHFNIEDDNASLNKKRFLELLALIVLEKIESKMNISISFPNGLRADTLDEQVVEMMRNAGVKRLFVAPESGVERVRKEIVKKNLSNEKIEQAVKLCVKYGITVDASLVIGFPGETKLEMIRTILYGMKLKRLGVAKIGLHLATPLPGSPLYQECKEKGYLREGDAFKTDVPMIDCKEFKGWQARLIQRIGNAILNETWKDKLKLR